MLQQGFHDGAVPYIVGWVLRQCRSSDHVMPQHCMGDCFTPSPWKEHDEMSILINKLVGPFHPDGPEGLLVSKAVTLLDCAEAISV